MFDRGGLPAELHDGLSAFVAEEGGRRPRVLAWGQGPDAVAVGLADRLVVGPEPWRAVPWHEIQRGGWDFDTRTLRWRTVSDPATEEKLALENPGQLPELFRERVEQTIVLQRTVELTGSKTVIVSARRSLAPGASGVIWSVSPGRGTNLRDPALAEAAEAELAHIRADWAF